MKLPDFILLLYENNGLLIYILTLLSCLTLLLVIIKNSNSGIFDTLTLVSLVGSVDVACLTILYINEAINSSVFFISIIGTIAYFLFIKYAMERRGGIKILVSYNEFFALLILTIMLIYKYYIWGIPLLYDESRLVEYFGNDRVLYSAINSSCEYIFISLLYYKFYSENNGRYTLTTKILIALYFIDGVFSGSKIGSVLMLLAIWQLSKYVANKKYKVKLIYYAPITITLILVFSIVAVKRYNISGISDIVDLLIFRIIQTSDIYFYSLNGINFISPIQGLWGLIEVVLPSLVKLFGGDPHHQNIGQIAHYHAYGYESLEAPNTRLIFVSVMAVGIFSILLCCILGYFTGYIRNFFLNNGSVYFVPYFFLFPLLFIDLPYAFGKIKWYLLANILILSINVLKTRK